MFSTNSYYAVNKTDQEASVYRSLTGENVRLIWADFDSEKEFI